MIAKKALDKAVICVIGLGYVGLPLAEAFSRKLKVIGFDINSKKVREMNQHNTNRNLIFTDNAGDISKADFIFICVPTPITESKEPDLSYIISAAETAGRNMAKGAVVVLESTVYPGVTEEIVKPILSEKSGLECGEGFSIGYCPERINPGDNEHTINKTVKVVAGIDEETTELLAVLYSKISPIYKASSIKTAEAAKVIENVQRDLNIALVNELAIIFGKMDLNTRDVLDAAGTKWNFHHYTPGLVGGHCIPVDPYYLVHKSREMGYHPQVITAGRTTNDNMPKHIAEMTITALKNVGKEIKGSRILIMGLTYKENVADTRETPTKGLIKELEGQGLEVLGYDPVLQDSEVEFGIRVINTLDEATKIDGIILTVAHQAFKEISMAKLKKIMNDKPVLIDVRGFFNGEDAMEEGIYYQTL